MSLKLDSGRDRQIWVKSESWRDNANKGKVRELERQGK